jgi:hypothetical protein
VSSGSASRSRLADLTQPLPLSFRNIFDLGLKFSFGRDQAPAPLVSLNVINGGIHRLIVNDGVALIHAGGLLPHDLLACFRVHLGFSNLVVRWSSQVVEVKVYRFPIIQLRLSIESR